MPVSTFRSLVRALAVLLVPTLALGGLLVTSPAQAQRIRPSFWGMHDNDWVTPPTVPVGSANLTTADTYWRAIEKTNGTFDWTRLDAQVMAAEAIGAQPMIVLGQTPRFHSPKPSSASYDDFMPNLRAWQRYVGNVAARYGTRLDYQIWPEPNIVQNWKGTPRQMATLTMAASRAIANHAGARAKVISPAVALRLPSQRAWTLNYFRQSVGGKRVAQYVDAIAIDPFPLTKGTPEDSFGLMRTIRKQLANIGVRKPLWNNEINYGVAGGHEASTIDYSLAKQQSYVIRTFALSAAAGMQRTYWLAWFHSPELAVDMTDATGLPLPPAKSYEVVRSWLNATSVNGCAKKVSGLWVCSARKSRTEVRRIYWKPSGTTAIRTPRSTLRVENQSGGVDTRRGARTIKVGFRPIMVASRK